MYLRDVHFTLRTDHANLTYLNTEHKQKVQRWKLAIQQYDFQIEHVAGVENIVADGFSRFCPYAPDDGEDEQEHHTLMHLIANTPEVDPMALSPRERAAPARKAERTRDHAIPAERYKILGQCHNSKVGHFKVNMTMERVRKLLEHTSMASKFSDWTNAELRRDVTAFIKKCPCCQKMNVLRPAIHAQPYTTSTWGVFDNLAIDVITGLPESEEGYCNLMVIIDTFSRYIELHPMKALTSVSAVKALEL